MSFKNLSSKVLTLAILIIIIGLGGYILKSKWDRKFYVNVSGAAVIKELRELNRLETASYTIEKIIDAGTNNNALSQLLFGDKILLIAHAEVIAGYDLSKLSEKDIKIEGKSITLNLPAPQILVTRLDNEKTRVYDRQQGIFSKGEKDLESEARKEAEISITKAACEAKILDEAKGNAIKQLTALLKALQFETIQINSPTGSC